MVQNNNVQLCLGIDPNAKENTFEKFKLCVQNHIEFLQTINDNLNPKILKLNLAFFLAYGSKGIELLEEICSLFKNKFTLILDGKFNEIQNSLQAYLHFVFQTLGAHGVTINPFLGENTLKLAFEHCVTHAGEKGRVFVLCATSESSTSTLSYLQENWKNKLIACQQIRDEIFLNDNNFKKCAGVVIGANKENILFSEEVKQSQLSILAPGLGFQGGNFSILKKCHEFKNEFTFPMSRSIFQGGQISKHEITENLIKFQNYFEGNYD